MKQDADRIVEVLPPGCYSGTVSACRFAGGRLVIETAVELGDHTHTLRTVHTPESIEVEE